MKCPECRKENIRVDVKNQKYICDNISCRREIKWGEHSSSEEINWEA